MVMILSSVYFGAAYGNGYYRNDGTYEQGHHRSDPDRYSENNWKHLNFIR